MQRSLPLYRSIALVCFSLSLGFGVQSVLLSGRSPQSSAALADQVQISASSQEKRSVNRLSPPPAIVRPGGKVVVDLSDRKVYLYSYLYGLESSNSGDEKKLAATYDVAIGQDDWETPLGNYQVGDMQTNPAWEHPLTGRVVPPGPDNPLGAAWISFLSKGDYSFGLHGTINESLIGQAVSHGCIRMRNADILALYGAVEPGWPLQVRP